MGLAVALVWVATVVVTRKLRKPDTFHIAASLYVLWNMLSVLWSTDVNRTLVQVTSYIQLLGLAIILWDLCTTRRAMLAMLQMYILGGFVLLGNTLINYTSGSTYYYERFSANGTNPDDLGLILALGLPVASYLASSIPASKFTSLLRLANYAYIPAALLGIALSGTRTALLAALPGLIFSIASLKRPRLWTRTAIFISMIGAGIVLLPFIPTASLQRLGTTGSELAGGDLNGRASLWRQGFASFEEHPLVGVGANMFRSVDSIGKVAHNSYLSVAVELGLIGFALFMLMIGIAARHAWRQRGWDRRLWLAVLVAWMIGVSTLTWENRKPTWLFLSLVVVSAGLVENRVKSGPTVQGDLIRWPTLPYTHPISPVPDARNELSYE
jgi:O-antigen ligase